MNEPRPGQLTVRDLRSLLEGVPDGVVVGICIPPGMGELDVTVLTNVRVEKRGPVLMLCPYDGEMGEPHPQRRKG